MDISAVTDFPASEIGQFAGLFRGTGRVALMCLAANTAGVNTFGGCNSNPYMSRRANVPVYVALTEMAKNKYLGREFFNTALAGTQVYASSAIYQPMKSVRWDDAAWTYKNLSAATVAAAYPQQPASIGSFTCDLSGKSTAVTRIGAFVGFTGTNSGVVKVTITDKITGLPVDANLLDTAAQAVASGLLAAGALVSNGGTIPDAQKVFGTNAVDCGRLGHNKAHEVPIADENVLALGSGQYTVQLEPTTVAGAGGGTPDRTYVAYLLYGTAAMSHLDTGAQLYRTGFVSAANDGSANDRSTLTARKTGSGSGYELMGGGHGHETDTSAVWSVDGRAVTLHAKTVSRARASGIATLVFDAAHGAAVGDLITVSGLASGAASSYNQEGATVLSVSQTTVPGDTLTYANTTIVGGAIVDEGTTADTAGLMFNHALVFGETIVFTQAATKAHSVDGALATLAATYTIDGIKMAVRPADTLSENCDVNTGTYLWLGTFWSASRATYGPKATGTKRIRQIDTQISAVLTAGGDVEVLSDRDGLGYIAFDPEGGIMTAVVSKCQPGPASKLFVQDRTPLSGGVKKAYLRYNDGGVVALKAGTVLRGGYDHYQTVRPGFANSLLVAL